MFLQVISNQPDTLTGSGFLGKQIKTCFMYQILSDYLQGRVDFLKAEIENFEPNTRGLGKTYIAILQIQLLEAENALKVANGGSSELKIK